ncbi:transposase [Streptomyces sp. NPDC059070]|uniref:transposase n=1 Tax=Streptomyces sp. NPDC059070 TaxID=3346713 RepID=UPI0036B818C3
MRACVADQNWLTLEQLPAYAPELNPVEPLWSAIKTRELTNLADAAERGIHRVCSNNPAR